MSVIAAYLRNIFQNRQGFDIEFPVDRRSSSLCTSPPASPGCSAASAHFAHHVYIRQKIHFDAALAFSLAGLASSTGDVE